MSAVQSVNVGMDGTARIYGEVGWVGGWRGSAMALRIQRPPVKPTLHKETASMGADAPSGGALLSRVRSFGEGMSRRHPPHRVPLRLGCDPQLTGPSAQPSVEGDREKNQATLHNLLVDGVPAEKVEPVSDER